MNRNNLSLNSARVSKKDCQEERRTNGSVVPFKVYNFFWPGLPENDDNIMQPRSVDQAVLTYTALQCCAIANFSNVHCTSTNQETKNCCDHYLNNNYTRKKNEDILNGVNLVRNRKTAKTSEGTVVILCMYYQLDSLVRSSSLLLILLYDCYYFDISMSQRNELLQNKHVQLNLN